MENAGKENLGSGVVQVLSGPATANCTTSDATNDLGSPTSASSELDQQKEEKEPNAVISGFDSVSESNGQQGQEEMDSGGIHSGPLVPTTQVDSEPQQNALSQSGVAVRGGRSKEYRLENRQRNQPIRLDTVQQIVTMDDDGADIFMQRLRIEEKRSRKSFSANRRKAISRHRRSTIARASSSGTSGGNSASSCTK